ncbi:hypothetical protein [Frigidibacter oleivorans]|uniref:hypothetical protein n=1 Tax=Frigidibacter oleivorans TaxID=2487129 RepID=UPI000F8C726C|nr:hypothetical protein [Frigidibacter oleivorans]
MIHSTAGAKIYIGPANSSAATEAEFAALSYVAIGEVEDLGEWGSEGAEITFASVADKHMRRRKGTIDSGVVELVCARDALDAGQIAARAAADSHSTHAFRVEVNDAPEGGTASTFYFLAVVLSARNTFSTADEITRTTFRLGIDGAILEIPAEAA